MNVNAELRVIASTLSGSELNRAVLAAVNVSRPMYSVITQGEVSVSENFSHNAGVIYGFALAIRNKRQLFANAVAVKRHIVFSALVCIMECIDTKVGDKIDLHGENEELAFAFLGKMACLSPDECGEKCDESGVTSDRFGGNVIDLMERRR